MAKLNKMSWVMDCLVNQWEHCSAEELVAQIVQGEPEDDARLEQVKQLVADWYNDKGGVRLKLQMSVSLDAEQEIRDWVSERIKTNRG